MNKYIVIYHATAEAVAGMQSATPEEMAEGMKPWMTWAEACGDGLIDMGTPPWRRTQAVFFGKLGER
jgi:hypothetical protein